jgi:hypothetical protein
MKLKSVLVAAAFAALLQSITAFAQAVTNGVPRADTEPTLSRTGLPGSLNQPQGARFFVIADPGRQSRDLTLGGRIAITKLPSLLLKPGVYKTAPYASIVIVPSKNPGDRIVVAPAASGSTMPVIKPELRLIALL